MRNKKVVRLTESQLHNIISESVNQILTEMVDEGQGWDLFKSVRDSYKNGKNREEDLADYNQDKNTAEFKQGKKNFINTGDWDGRKGYVYRKKWPEEVGDPNMYKSMKDVKRIQGDLFYNDWKPVNNSWRGKLGRRAGLAAAQGYLGYQNLKNRLRDR